MKFKALVLSSLFFLVAATNQATAETRIVTSTTDLASIAELIGGEHVKVESICRGAGDPHFVQMLPSYMVKVARADIYLRVGMDLDFWANQIIDGSQNGKLIIVDCSQNIEPMEVPRGRVDASMGDIHIQGNPHYWLDPRYGINIGEVILSALKQADPKNSAAYDKGFENFKVRLEAKIDEWQIASEAINGKEIVTFHNSWPYFARFFGIRVAAFVEPKPGIAPTPSHTAQLIEMMSDRDIKVIGREPYYSDRTPKSIAQQTGGEVIVLPTSVKGVDEAKDYFMLFDTLLARLTDALEE